MPLRLMLLLVCTVAWGDYRNPDPTLPDSVTLKTVTDLISQKKVDSVDALLDALASHAKTADMLDQPVLVYDSQSQHGNSRGGLFPRMILYGGRLVLAVSGDPEGPNANVVEAIAYEMASESFKFSNISFSQGTAPAYGGDTDCKRCHGAVLRPLWNSYPLWPGIYFGFLDEFGRTKKNEYDDEGKMFQVFLKENYKKGRYRHVKFDEKKGKRGVASVTSKANSNLDYMLSLLNYRRILSGLREWDGYKKYQFAIVGSFLGCEPVPELLPASVRKAHEKRLVEIYPEVAKKKYPKDTRFDSLRHHTEALIEAETSQRLNYFKYVNKKSQHLYRSTMFDLKDIERITRLRYVIEGGGHSMQDWAITRLPGEHELSFSLGNGAWGIGDLAKWHLLPVFRKENPYAAWDIPAARPSYAPDPYEVADRGAACSELKKRSLAALKE